MSHRKKHPAKFTPGQMILRCYAEQKGQLWQAFCIDLNLAAQGSSLHEVKHKLHDQIGEYLYDALSGEDRKYAAQLLSRKAPIKFFAKYYYIKTLCQAKIVHDGIRETFNEIVPLAPAYHA